MTAAAKSFLNRRVTPERKLTYNEVLERLNDETIVHADEVDKEALRKHVFVVAYAWRGGEPCGRSVHKTKKDALAHAKEAYIHYAPRGFLQDLRKRGVSSADERDQYSIRITRVRLAEVL